MADIIVDLLECFSAADDEIFLHGDIEIRPFKIAREEFAAVSELTAHAGEEELFVPAAHPCAVDKVLPGSGFMWAPGPRVSQVRTEDQAVPAPLAPYRKAASSS